MIERKGLLSIGLLAATCGSGPMAVSAGAHDPAESDVTLLFFDCRLRARVVIPREALPLDFSELDPSTVLEVRIDGTQAPAASVRAAFAKQGHEWVCDLFWKLEGEPLLEVQSAWMERLPRGHRQFYRVLQAGRCVRQGAWSSSTRRLWLDVSACDAAGLDGDVVLGFEISRGIEKRASFLQIDASFVRWPLAGMVLALLACPVLVTRALRRRATT